MLFLLVGLGLIVWLADKAIRYPGIRASQLGYSAPLWVPSILFVALFTGASVFIFERAARRVQSGEDLFSKRHRRRPGEDAG